MLWKIQSKSIKTEKGDGIASNRIYIQKEYKREYPILSAMARKRKDDGSYQVKQKNMSQNESSRKCGDG